MLIANYGGMLAFSTELPYCLYTIVYERDAEQSIFNEKGGPTTMHSSECVCRSLPSHPVKKSDGSHVIIPCSVHFDHFLPEIILPHSYAKPLIDANTGESYPMVPVGDFCLKDCLFPGCPLESLLFWKDELDALHRKGFIIPTYREEPHKTSSCKEEARKTSSNKETHKSSSSKEESHKSSSKASETSTRDVHSTHKPSSHWDRESLCSKKHRDLPQAKEHRNKHDSKEPCAQSCDWDKDKFNHEHGRD